MLSANGHAGWQLANDLALVRPNKLALMQLILNHARKGLASEHHNERRSKNLEKRASGFSYQ